MVPGRNFDAELGPSTPMRSPRASAPRSADAAPRGAIVVLPELPTRLAEPQAIADAVGAALKDGVHFVVAYDLDEETMLKRADAEHAARSPPRRCRRRPTTSQRRSTRR